MTILMTIAGRGSRFASEGYSLPKPLIPVNGLPMVVQAVKCLPTADKYVFVCNRQHCEDFELDTILTNTFENVEIVTIDEVTEGQAVTAQIGIEHSSIAPDDDILISSCDYGLRYDLDKYDSIDSDIIVWATTNNKAFASNPSAYSWLELHENKIANTYVKTAYYNDPFNEHAIVGTFYFRKSKHFLDLVREMYDRDIRSNGEYYIDNIFTWQPDRLVPDASIFTVEEYICWGTPKDLENYEN